MLAFLETGDADFDRACSASPPSSSACEDLIEIVEADVSFSRLQSAVRTLLRGLGEDAQREGLRETPRRVAKAWIDATLGYRQTVRSVLGGALFHEEVSSGRESTVVLIQDVDFAATSEHNLLPFFGRCHIAYVPRNGVVLGLSKVARLAKMFSRRLQNQRRLTEQLLEAFNAEVQPLGCAAVVEAQQLGEGMQSQHVTCAALGCFCEQPQVYLQEFAVLLGRPALFPGSSEAEPSAASSFRGTTSPSHGYAEAPRSPSNQSVGEMVAAVEAILREVGEDPSRPGLQGSPERYVKHLLAATSGACDLVAPLHSDCSAPWHEPPAPWPQADSSDGVCLRFTSQCEHHLLPFQGTVQIACLPGQQGSRLTRKHAEDVVRAFSGCLQIQERLTHQVAQFLSASLAAAGVLVLCRATHMCMVARGVEKHASSTLTTAALGAYELDHALRRQALVRLMASERGCAPE